MLTSQSTPKNSENEINTEFQTILFDFLYIKLKMSAPELMPKVEDREYIKSVLNRMVKDIALIKPNEKDVPQFMMKWLMKDGEIDGNLLNFEEKGELCKLRRKIIELRKIDEHFLFANPPQPAVEDKKDKKKLAMEKAKKEKEKEKEKKKQIKDPKKNLRGKGQEVKEEVKPKPAPVLTPVKKSPEDFNFLKTRIMLLKSFNCFDLNELEQIIKTSPVKSNFFKLITQNNIIQKFR